MDEIMTVNKNAGTVKIMTGKNSRQLYEHQVNAIAALNKIDA